MAVCLLWCCTEKNASWSAKEVFGRHGMAVGNHLINHRWFTKYYLPQIITSCRELFTYHGPNHQMILLHQGFRLFTPSEYLPGSPLYRLSCPVKFSTCFDHSGANSTSVPTQANCLFPEPLCLWRDSPGSSHTDWLAKWRPTINFSWEGPRDKSQMGPKCKTDLELRILNGILWA